MRERYKTILKQFLTWGILLIFAYIGFKFFKENKDEFKSIEFDWGYCLPFILGVLANYFFRGEMHQALVQPFGVFLKWWEKSGLALVSAVFDNLIPANAGIVFKMAYLGKVHKVQWMPLGLYFIISWVAFSIVDSAAVIIALVLYGYIFSPMALVFFILFLGSIALFVLPTNIPLLGRFQSLKRIHESWVVFKKSPKHGIRILKAAFFILLANTLIIWSGSKMMSYDVDFLASFLMAGVRSSSTIINITPGSLGFTESLLAITTDIIGMGPVKGVTISALFRVGFVGVGLILSPFFLRDNDEKD